MSNNNIFFSATWPEGVRSLAAKLLKDPIHVIVGSLDLQAASTVSQQVIICKEEEKRDKVCLKILSCSCRRLI